MRPAAARLTWRAWSRQDWCLRDAVARGCEYAYSGTFPGIPGYQRYASLYGRCLIRFEAWAPVPRPPAGVAKGHRVIEIYTSLIAVIEHAIVPMEVGTFKTTLPPCHG